MPDFFVIATPPSTPTACVACHSSQDPGGFVDCERDLPGYGTVYLCATCARQIGARFGMVTSEEADTLEEAVVELHRQLDGVQHELAEASDRVLLTRADLEAMFARSSPDVSVVRPKAAAGSATDKRRGPK